MNATVRLSDDDRARIAAQYGCAHVPEAVTVLPRGASSYALPVWCGAKNQLVYPDWDRRRKEAQASLHNTRKMTRAVDPAVMARREAVAQAHAEGLTVADMAARLSVDGHTVRRDLATLGLSAHQGVRKPHAVPPQVIERRERILALARDGMRPRQIAAEVSLDESTVRAICRRFGIALAAPPKPAATPKPRKSDLIAERNATVAAMAGQGMTAEAIAEKVGVSAKWVAVLLGRAGLARQNQREDSAARLDRIREMAGRGVSTRDMAAALGISVKRAQVLRRDAGVSRPMQKGQLPEGFARRHRAQTELVRARQARVLEMTEAGMSLRKIAEVLGVHHRRVEKDRVALGLVGSALVNCLVRATKVNQPTRAEYAAERQAVADAVACGMSRVQIMAELRIGRMKLYRHLKVMGLIGVRGPGKRGREGASKVIVERVERRRAQVAQLRAEGLSAEEICARIPAGRTTIYSDLRALGAA